MGPRAMASGRGRRPAGGRPSGFGRAGERSPQQRAQAAAAAAELVAGLPAGTVLGYCDGACRGNPGPAGAGVLVELPDGRALAASLALGHGTNNIAELTAVDLALDLLDEARVPPAAAVALLTDSSYAHGLLCLGWKAKANQELVADLRARVAERPGLTIHWVAGHAGTPGNEAADRLAGQGVAGVSARTWLP